MGLCVKIRFAAALATGFSRPYGSLSPRMTVGEIMPRVKSPFPTYRDKPQPTVAAVLEVLPTEIHTRYPHEFSGGQRQRIAIARL